MPAQYTRADALREYLTGGGSDGAVQIDPDLSLGNFRSSIEAISRGIYVNRPINNVKILYAGGQNPTGVGNLIVTDSNDLAWQPPGASSPGLQVNWPSNVNLTQIVEALGNSGQYLRINATAPFDFGNCQVTLTDIYNGIFGFDTCTPAEATAGSSNYRATILHNEGIGSIISLQRYIGQLGTQQVSNSGGLPASGSGTITTTGSFADWPKIGYCQVQNSGGTLKELVYYSSRTNTALTVPASGRSMLGTTNTAGNASDLVYAVPGVAIGIDSAGVQASGSSIQTVANQTTAPAGITWNLGLTPATGLQFATIGVGQLVGVWFWRQVPAGVVATPVMANSFLDSFKTF